MKCLEIFSERLASLVERAIKSPNYALSNARSIIDKDVVLIDTYRLENSVLSGCFDNHMPTTTPNTGLDPFL